MIISFFIPHAGCSHQCVFCNQNKITGQVGPADASAIPGRIRDYLKTNSHQTPTQVAFFGGSFTALPIEMQTTYLESVQPFLRSGLIESIRISTRPDCISRTVLKVLRKYGVATIELGVQSMDDQVLIRSGRGHTSQDSIDAVALIKGYGFAVGLQLMPGLPGDSADRFQSTIAESIRLRPDAVRMYPALVIEGTPLAELHRAGQYTPLTLDEAVALCSEAFMKFEYAGIKVIRMGLQPTIELEFPGTILAGPYHAAFGQLVKSSVFFKRMRDLLSERTYRETTAIFQVHRQDLSTAVGQRRENVEKLKKEFGLREIHIVESPNAQRGGIPILLSAS